METSFNPWRGLSSYEDPEKIERQYLFMGREVETDALVRLIDNNLFVTLYGRAGVGKTSLLRAGVFPVLRKRGYFPLYIRLALESDDIDYAKTIVDKIEEAASESNFNVNHNKALPTNSDAKSFLWEYFAAASFADHDGNVIYPVIVLDQFEEIFLADTDKAHNLLLQIHAMLNDDYEASEEQNSATNYRFVASIREDMLFHLEDCIDENHLALLKNNRYRLRPLSDEKAKEAVLGPGAGFLMKGEENVIAERIIEASREKDGTISSLILSLLCSQLYVRAEREMEKNRQKNDDENEQYSSDVLLAHNEMYAHKQKPYSKPIISINQIPVTDEGTDNILTEFFKANTDSKQRRIIEKLLLTQDGHRKPADVISIIPNCKDLLAEGNHILQRVKTAQGTKVEIVHDRMASVIYKLQQKQNNKRLRFLIWSLFIISAIIVYYIAIKVSWNSALDSNNLAYISPNTRYENVNDEPSEITINQQIAPELRISEYAHPRIKHIYIGKDVQNIDSLSIMNDDVVFHIDSANQYIKQGEILLQLDSLDNTLSLVEYVYYPNRRDTKVKCDSAIYLSKSNIYPKAKCRLPDDIKSIKYIHYKSNQESELRTLNQDPSLEPYSAHESTVLINDTVKLRYINKDKYLKQVQLSQSINKICENAFSNCTKLENINLNNVDTIECFSFFLCSSLKELNWGVENGVINGRYAFSSCLNLKKATLPKTLILKASTSTDLFYNCRELEEIWLPDSIDLGEKPTPWKLITLFRYCPKIKTVHYDKNNPHYTEDNGVILYDSVPIIFNLCKSSNYTWEFIDKKSTLFYNNGMIKNLRGNSETLVSCMNPKKLLTLKNTGYWKAAYGSSYQSKGKDGKDKLTTTHFEVFPLSPNDNVLFLPPTDTITPYYNIFNSIETPITEIHIPNATPTLYDCINFVNDIDKRDITLYVPYGCRDAYERNGVYNVYKDIKEDSLEGRVYATFIGAWDIIGRNVGSIWLTFILPILLLIILSTSFVIYKYKQAVSNKKVKSKKTIIIKSVLYCIVFSILAFIPAFWLVFYLFTCKIGGLSFVLILILSILAGLLAAVFCIYLFIFAGKGNIFTRNQ